MAKWAHDNVMDGALNIIKGDNRIMTACSAQPASREEAVTTYKLADVAMATGDFTISNGDINGRKVRMAEKAAVPVDSSGEANHVAICDATNLLLVTTCTPQQLTAGNTVTFPAWDDEIADPA